MNLFYFHYRCFLFHFYSILEHIVLRIPLIIYTRIPFLQVGDNNAAKVLNITSTFASVAFHSLQNNNKTLFSRPSLGN